MVKHRLDNVRSAINDLNSNLSVAVVGSYSDALQRTVRSKTLFSSAGWEGEDIIRSGKLRRSFRIWATKAGKRYQIRATNTARSKKGYNYPERVRRGYTKRKRGRDFYYAALYMLRQDPKYKEKIRNEIKLF